LIKICLRTGYTAQKLLKEFSSKSWNEQSLQGLLKSWKTGYSWHASREHLTTNCA